MSKLFFIEYEVDTGYEHIKDKALINAEDEENAKEILGNFINRIGNEYMISKIFEIDECKNVLFTQKHGFSININNK